MCFFRKVDSWCAFNTNHDSKRKGVAAPIAIQTDKEKPRTNNHQDESTSSVMSSHFLFDEYGEKETKKIENLRIKLCRLTSKGWRSPWLRPVNKLPHAETRKRERERWREIKYLGALLALPTLYWLSCQVQHKQGSRIYDPFTVLLPVQKGYFSIPFFFHVTFSVGCCCCWTCRSS